jgi:hypothetical protein
MTIPSSGAADISTPADLRAVVDAAMQGLAQVPDDGWERPAHHLTWTCRATVAHLLDDCALYAMNLASREVHTDGYVPVVDPPDWQPGAPGSVLWPDPQTGTAGIVRCVVAAGGLLVAVTATAPPGHLGYHPRGNSDASGFAAMGITEVAAHTWDVLAAHDLDLRLDGDICERVLNRIFPGASRTADPWHDLLTATGRTDETRGQRWTWDSSVREGYGG